MKRRVRSRRHRRGCHRHRRSAQVLERRQERAPLHMCVVPASCMARRPVRRMWLGSPPRLVFDRACTHYEDSALLELAAKDLGQRL